MQSILEGKLGGKTSNGHPTKMVWLVEAAFGEKPTRMSGVFFWEAKLVGFSGGRGT